MLHQKYLKSRPNRHRHQRRSGHTLRGDKMPRWLTWLAWASVVVAVIIFCGLWPVMAHDLLMHLASGQWTWRHGDVLRVDPFNYPNAGHPFVAHSWLAEVVFYLIEQTAGTVGFMLLRFALSSAALTFSLGTARILKAPGPVLLLLAPCVLGIVWYRLEFRPQLFTTLLLAAELWLIISVHLGHRSWRWLWVLPPMMALWINLHGGWVQGLAMLAVITGAVAAMAIRRHWSDRGVTSAIPLRPLMLVLGACLLALLLNPYGWRLVVLPLEMEASWIRAMTPEWQSPWGNPAGWGNVGAGLVFSLSPLFWIYVALLVGALLLAIKRWRTGDLIPVAVMGVWLALSLRHLRTVADAVLLTSPFVAASFAAKAWHTRRWPVAVGIGGLSTLVAVAVWGLWQVPNWRWSWQWDHLRPRCVEAVVARIPQPVRVFGWPLWAIWLLYDQPGHVQVTSIYWDYVMGQRLTAELEHVWTSPAAVKAHLERYHVEVILQTREDLSDIPLFRSWGYELIHTDARFYLMMKRTPATEMFIHEQTAFPRPRCVDGDVTLRTG